MKRAHSIWLAGLVAIALASTQSFGQVLYSQNFDSLNTGTINNQDSWQGWDNNPANAGTVVTTFAHSGTKSQMTGNNSDSVRKFNFDVLPPTNTGKFIISIYQYIPTGSTGGHYFLFLDQYADTGPYFWSVQLHFDEAAGVATNDANGATIAIVRDQWVQLRVEVDLTVTAVTSANCTGQGGICGSTQVYYNNCPLGARYNWIGGVSAAPSAVPDRNLTNSAIDLYTDTGPAETYYDDLTIEAVPALAPQLAITTTGLPVALRNASYSGQINASGGSNTGFTYTLDNGSLPTGLSLSSSGAVTGTPTVAGASVFRVKVTDSASSTAVKTYRVEVLDCTDTLLGMRLPANPPSELVTFRAASNTVLSTIPVTKANGDPADTFGLAFDRKTYTYYTLSDEGAAADALVFPNLYTVNPVTGVVTLVGQVNYEMDAGYVGGLAINPVDGALWAVLAKSTTPILWQIIQINKTNAQVVSGPVGFGVANFADSIAFTNSGTMLAVSGRTSLVQVDRDIGVLTAIGTMTGGGGSSGMTYLNGVLIYENAGKINVVHSGAIVDNPTCGTNLPNSTLSSTVLVGGIAANMWGLVAPTSARACMCPGDMNNDGRVNAADTAGFAGALANPYLNQCADINHDCVANGTDIKLFLDQIFTANGFGTICGGNPPSVTKVTSPPASNAVWCSFTAEANSECVNPDPNAGGIFCVVCSGSVCSTPLGGIEKFIWLDAPGGPCLLVGNHQLGETGNCQACIDSAGTYRFQLVP